MKEYREIVEEYYNSNSSNEIDNGSIEHAKVVVEFLFKKAEEQKKDVKIVTGRLDGDFYSKFVASAKNILKNNTISIISHEECHDSEFKDAVMASDNGSLLVANTKFKSLPHFILIGNNAYRFENDDILKTAKASFNKKSFATFLDQLFLILKK